MYGQEINDETEPSEPQDNRHLRIPLDVVADMYEKYVIPLTKEVEVEYLLHRLDHGHVDTNGLAMPPSSS